MIYRVFHPEPALCHIVDYYWYISAQPDEIPDQQYFYTPLLQVLAFNFNKKEEHYTLQDKKLVLDKQAYFFGQGTGPRIATSNEVNYLGVKFKPLGIVKLIGVNMEHLVDQIINVEDLWGNELELLWDEMQSMPDLAGTINVLEDFLIRKHLKAMINNRVDCVQNALTLITKNKGNIDIKTLQEQTNTSRKTLERAFHQNLGIHPKLYSRIVRFNAAKNAIDRMVSEESLTSIALDFGYYDSSHFIAEFKNFSGLTPLGYLKKNGKDFEFSEY